jgi:hypothetical protein
MTDELIKGKAMTDKQKAMPDQEDGQLCRRVSRASARLKIRHQGSQETMGRHLIVDNWHFYSNSGALISRKIATGHAKFEARLPFKPSPNRHEVDSSPASTVLGCFEARLQLE